MPAPTPKRWVIRRKAEVVAAVRDGLLTLEEACSRYMLTVEEFLSWQYSIDQYGLARKPSNTTAHIGPSNRPAGTRRRKRAVAGRSVSTATVAAGAAHAGNRHPVAALATARRQQIVL
jgi:hypothetical protein